jgi:Domain of unknown function (DUF4202)
MNQRFREAIARFDAANAADPHRVEFEGREWAKELLYAERMSRWLARLAPEASEALQLAVRSQHLCRWMIPRSEYPMDRAGYQRWRTDLQRFHAERAGKILREVGYEEEMVARVQALLRKERLKLNPETQLLEDVACLVFLESYFADFSQQHDEEKLIPILRRTWAKMSAHGREAALTLDLAPEQRELIEKALASS